jgi:hypothetical protein
MMIHLLTSWHLEQARALQTFLLQQRQKKKHIPRLLIRVCSLKVTVTKIQLTYQSQV